MEEFDFTEDEIREQLDILGYSNVPPERLQEFKRDLESLVRHERSKNSSLFSTSEQSSSSDSEATRGRAHIQVNGLSRPPLDDTNHRQPTNSAGNTSSIPHSAYGKENIYIAPPKSTTSHAVSEPKHHHQRTEHGLGPQQRALDYSLYMDPPPPARPLVGELSRGVREDGGGDEGNTTLDTSTTSTERRIMKRKVLRKRDGHREIYETESESGDIDSIQERLRNLGLSVDLGRPATAPPGRPESAATYTCRRAISARDPDPSYRLPDDYEGPKALIRPMKCDPHLKNVRKADPVSKYQQYRTSWDCHRAPGEKAHKGLRWGVREQMLYHDKVIDKKQKVFIPNNYKVPTDKKRKNLRWQIRNDLAQGVVPPSMFD